MVPSNRLNPSLSVVIACHNEEGNIAHYDRELFPILDSLGVTWEVIIVDDGSFDETKLVASALAKSRPNVSVVSLASNQGLGAALRAGFSPANGQWIATLDADLTFRPSYLKDMLAAATGADVSLVAGSPYLRAGDMRGVPWVRRLPSMMMNALYRGLFGMRLTSYTPIFRLYRAAALRRLALQSEGFEINAEIAACALAAGWKIAEVPVPLETRSSGISKLRRGRELNRHLRLIARLLSP